MDNSISSKYLFEKIQKELTSVYEINETQSIASLVLEKLFGISRSAIILDKNIKGFSKETEKKLDQIILRLRNSEPIQYVLGETEFYGKIMKVSPAVLIPRPETEELVDLIIKENYKREDLKILDICTGSGCIAIALQTNLKNNSTFALDISQKAIHMAARNAIENQSRINLRECDILKEEIPWQKISFDIIVSNPPYIGESERRLMQKNVLDHEPSLALFVKDTAPLIFYERIIKLSKTCLVKGGRLYFEINERFGDEISALFSDNGFKDVEIIKDLSGKDRIAKGSYNP
ncbi:MAG TPA: peptide chain release factor N(5)-glutamine methyltransferase [Cytophagales bacterium]|nr:peptide chain release factor N(5)-glutamine methyltransferase [Cytophagales bacterium]